MISFQTTDPTDLVQRCQIHTGSDILEVKWDKKNHQVVVSDDSGITTILTSPTPHSITLQDVLDSLDCKNINVRFSSIAMNNTDKMMCYNYHFKLFTDILVNSGGSMMRHEMDVMAQHWKDDYNRVEEVLSLPLEVEILSKITAMR